MSFAFLKAQPMSVKITIAVLVAALLIFLQLTGLLWVNRMNVTSVYTRTIRNHLEEKYEEPFYVYRRWFGRGPHAGLFGTHGFPIASQWYAYPHSDPTFVFQTTVVRNYDSAAGMNQYRMIEIRDTYYWRFLREKLQEYIEYHFKDLLGGDIKVDLNMSQFRNLRGFPEYLNHSSSIEDFFDSSASVDVILSIITPISDESMREEVRSFTRGFVSQLYESGAFSNNSYFGILHIADVEKYRLIDTSFDDDIRHNYIRMGGVTFGRSFEPVFWRPSTHSREASQRFSDTFSSIFGERFRVSLERVEGDANE